MIGSLEFQALDRSTVGSGIENKKNPKFPLMPLPAVITEKLNGWKLVVNVIQD